MKILEKINYGIKILKENHEIIIIKIRLNREV